ncbi:phosphopantetheine-binding protein [Mangrovihabitans endophyticus]|uniref:Carrier domain-containing protein n=1 Tax=Mangrovihabitans endophyticus TaxID=1751298 RepID=A0A8J3FMP2_9ACTN|nr:phosphopantetheine-binding protein [Mangrovihabitans endophyticus]GGK74811.1 hypothetical protein GCM10012284_05950 [Mangrovihabitans endophyticus]
MTRVPGVRFFLGREPLPVAELTGGEAAQYAALPPHGPRRRAWLTGRHALRRALVWTGRPADTSRVTFPHDAVSLSYSGAIAVVAATDGAVAGIGVDVETGPPPDIETARVFLRDGELRMLRRLPPPRQPGALLRWWTVKEALFKADPDNHLGGLRRYVLGTPPGGGGVARRAAGRCGAGLSYRSFALRRGYLSVALALDPTRSVPPMANRDFSELAAKLAPLISRPAATISPDLTMNDLALDSMTAVEMVVDLQEDYDILLSRADLESCATLGDLAELIWSRLPGAAGNEPVRG